MINLPKAEQEQIKTKRNCQSIIIIVIIIIITLGVRSNTLIALQIISEPLCVRECVCVCVREMNFEIDRHKNNLT